MEQPKVIEKLMIQIKKMTFPSFIVYDWDSNTPHDLPLNKHHGFIKDLAYYLHYLNKREPKTLLEIFVDNMRYSFWGKCEYEHWIGNEKIEKDGVYEQFLRWASGCDIVDYCNEKFPKLEEYLKDHDLQKMYNKQILKNKRKKSK